MASQSSRSDEVIEDYKKHKLARSALRHIQELLHSFEQERIQDRKFALIGIGLMVAVIGLAYFFLGGSDSIIIR